MIFHVPAFVFNVLFEVDEKIDDDDDAASFSGKFSAVSLANLLDQSIPIEAMGFKL